MKNLLPKYKKSCAKSAGRRLLALLLTCASIFTFAACAGEKTTAKAQAPEPVRVVRETEPQALQTASQATAIALRQYVYARLLTEAFLSVDASSLSAQALFEMADSLYIAWENAQRLSLAATALTDRAVLLMQMPTVKPSSVSEQPRAKTLVLGAAPKGFQVRLLSADSPRKLDPETWAENLTKQFDALKGAKRYQQLARQLGTDAKTAYEQMALAQKIIRNAAELEEAEGMVDAYTQSINYLQGIKTTSKVAMLGWSMAATGGGSVALLEGAGLLVGGVDCIVDVAETGSTLILGENNQVAVAFGDIKDKLGPVSSLVGLATLNPADVGKKAKDTVDAMVYITDSLVDLFYEDKIVGIKVEGVSQEAISISGELFEAGANAALEAAGFLYPSAAKTVSQLAGLWASEPESMAAQMDALAAKMAEQEWAAGIEDAVLPEPHSTEEVLPTPGGEESSAQAASDISIFGEYTCVATGGVKNETLTSTIAIRDDGNGTLRWIDEDGDATYLSYDPATNIIHTESEGLTIHIEFSRSDNTVSGSGYMRGTFWGEPVEESLSLTKISD